MFAAWIHDTFLNCKNFLNLLVEMKSRNKMIFCRNVIYIIYIFMHKYKWGHTQGHASSVLCSSSLERDGAHVPTTSRLLQQIGWWDLHILPSHCRVWSCTNSAARLSHAAAGVEPSGVCAIKPCRDLPLNTQVCLISSFSVFWVLLLFSFSVVLAGRALLCEGPTRWLGSSYGSFYTLTLSLAVES